MMQTRATIQRALVLKTVNELHGHATADQIFERVSQEHPSISRSTVYRNLNFLASDGKILKIRVPDAADFYESKNMPHYHVRCIKCQRLFDVDLDFMTGLENQIKDKHGFDIIDHELTFSGICPDCKRQAEHSDHTVTIEADNDESLSLNGPATTKHHRGGHSKAIALEQ